MARAVSQDVKSEAAGSSRLSRAPARKTPPITPRAASARSLKKTVPPQTARLPAWTKAHPIALKPEMPLDDAMAVVLAACQAHWQVNMAAAVDGRQPEGTHQVRVALRRLRSALSVFKKHIPAAQRTALNTEAKWLLGQLGPARDLDVFIQNLTAPLASKVSEDAELAQLIRAARRAQNKAHAEAAKALRSARATRFNARLEAWIGGHGWRTEKTEKSDAITVQAFARRFVNRRMRNIQADYNDIESLSVAERHELRIAVKKVRYGLEFFQAVLPAKRGRLLASTLKHLQDTLGHLNDIDVAERTVSALVNAGTTGTERRQVAAGGTVVSAWHKQAAKDAEPETVKLWRKMKKVPAF
ncbi:MAG: CHAD domain-containing protein [Rhodospirillaceae bacterium]|nr:CHAD domain-containing protein [Rhodospirillaceae bacterium]